MGKSQASVNKTLRLLELPEAIRADYRSEDGAGEWAHVSKSLLLEISRQGTPAQKQMLWEAAKRGELTVKDVRARKPARTGGKSGIGKSGRGTSNARKGSSDSALMTFRYPIATAEATVTVQFARPKATPQEIIQALEEALSGEKARLTGD